jgi:hypothetical protein
MGKEETLPLEESNDCNKKRAWKRMQVRKERNEKRELAPEVIFKCVKESARWKEQGEDRSHSS